MAKIYNKSFNGWGFTPDPTGELTAHPQTPRWQRERERRGRGGKGKRGNKEEEEGVEGKEREKGGEVTRLLNLIWLRPCLQAYNGVLGQLYINITQLKHLQK